jgi:hypothetical protein
MDRRKVIVSGIATGLLSGITAAGGPARAQDGGDQGGGYGDAPRGGDGYRRDDQGQDYRRGPDDHDAGDHDRGDHDRGRYGGPSEHPASTYSAEEIARNVSDFFGVTAENAGALIEKIFHENGRPTAYIAGQEGSGAFFFGLRYGKGLMYMKDRPRIEVFWQGPTGGFDFGGNASRTFTLCYDLQYPDAIFRRFPGVEGSAYFIGGLGANYQRADGITLAPIRAGVGLRLGASLGYLAYSRQRNVIPL